MQTILRDTKNSLQMGRQNETTPDCVMPDQCVSLDLTLIWSQSAQFLAGRSCNDIVEFLYSLRPELAREEVA